MLAKNSSKADLLLVDDYDPFIISGLGLPANRYRPDTLSGNGFPDTLPGNSSPDTLSRNSRSGTVMGGSDFVPYNTGSRGNNLLANAAGVNINQQVFSSSGFYGLWIGSNPWNLSKISVHDLKNGEFYSASDNDYCLVGAVSYRLRFVFDLDNIDTSENTIFVVQENVNGDVTATIKSHGANNVFEVSDVEYWATNINLTISGGPGTDTLRLYKNPVSYAFAITDGGQLVLSTINENLTLSGVEYIQFGCPTGDTFKVWQGTNQSETIQTGKESSLVIGGDGNDVLLGRYGNNYLVGGNGNDTIIFGSGNDTISGDDGDDYIDAGNGNNIVYGGKGDDIIYTGSGNDAIWGHDGNNWISGGGGSDTISGGKDNDTIDGGAGDDRLFSGNGNNRLFGRDGNDYIQADAGNNSVYGGTGNDTIYAGADNDLIYGQDGDDEIACYRGNNRIFGGDGNDTITSYHGNDLMSGDAGDDEFHITLSAGYIHTVTVSDFGNGNDKLTLLETGLSSVDVFKQKALLQADGYYHFAINGSDLRLTATGFNALNESNVSFVND